MTAEEYVMDRLMKLEEENELLKAEVKVKSKAIEAAAENASAAEEWIKGQIDNHLISLVKNSDGSISITGVGMTTKHDKFVIDILRGLYEYQEENKKDDKTTK